LNQTLNLGGNHSPLVADVAENSLEAQGLTFGLPSYLLWHRQPGGGGYHSLP